MEKILSNFRNEIWNFPAYLLEDKSITKLDTIKLYEDSHGTGNLNDATHFSYTSHNKDIWVLPGKSYLKITAQLRKADNSEYVWRNVAAVEAQGNQAAVAARNRSNVCITDNACNIFSEARYYVDDQEIERIEHLGIGTLINNLITYTDASKLETVKYSELFFLDDDTERKTYVLNTSSGTVQFLIPLSRIFPFLNQVQHAFRGVKHRITFDLNSADNLIHKGANVDAGKVYITKMEWVVPYAEPDLTTMASLESQLASQTVFDFSWKGINVFRTQPLKAREVRIPLSATIHKPTDVFIAIQALNRTTSQDHNAMIFDTPNIESVSVEINGLKFPQRDIVCNKDENDLFEAYNTFIKACNNEKGLSFKKWKTHYFITYIDVSHHAPEIYDNSTFPNIVVNLKFREPMTEDYLAWITVYNNKTASLNLEQQKMRVIR